MLDGLESILFVWARGSRSLINFGVAVCLRLKHPEFELENLAEIARLRRLRALRFEVNNHELLQRPNKSNVFFYARTDTIAGCTIGRGCWFGQIK